MGSIKRNSSTAKGTAQKNSKKSSGKKSRKQYPKQDEGQLYSQPNYQPSQQEDTIPYRMQQPYNKQVHRRHGRCLEARAL